MVICVRRITKQSDKLASAYQIQFPAKGYEQLDDLTSCCHSKGFEAVHCVTVCLLLIKQRMTKHIRLIREKEMKMWMKSMALKSVVHFTGNEFLHGHMSICKWIRWPCVMKKNWQKLMHILAIRVRSEIRNRLAWSNWVRFYRIWKIHTIDASIHSTRANHFSRSR